MCGWFCAACGVATSMHELRGSSRVGSGSSEGGADGSVGEELFKWS